MRVTLQVISGSSAGRRYDVRNGLVARFGRTEWADFCLRDDAALADIHFELDCRGPLCRLQQVAATGVTLVNGEAVKSADLRTGDQLRAGNTLFAIYVEGDEGRSREEDTKEGEPSAAAVDSPAARKVPEICAYLELEEADRKLAQPEDSPEQYLERLLAGNRLLTALRWQAHVLPRREAVWWGCLAVAQTCGEQLAGAQQEAWASARAWVLEPAEDRRRAAEQAAQRARHEGPGGMLAAAAFWSGDNIGPAELSTPIPPDERLTGVFVSGALVVASYLPDARHAPDRQRQYVQLSRDVAAGKARWQ